METRALIIPMMLWFTMILEVVGVLIIVGAAIVATASLISHARAGEWNAVFRQYRADVGRGILLGLEFLVAADIIGTVAVTPSFESLGVLASIIFIRTFLSISLEVEIEGHWPWRRWEAESRDPAGQRL